MPRYSYTPSSYQGARRQLIYGLVLVVIGVGITVGTYTWASQQGGTYFISFGPIIVGLIRVVTAIPVLMRSGGQGRAPSIRAGGPPFSGVPPGSGAPWGAAPPGGVPGAGMVPGPGAATGPGAAPGSGAPWGMAAQSGTASWGSVGAGGVVAAPGSPAPTSAPLEPGHAPVAGWYTDPSGAHALRWWDGSGWTEQIRDHQ